MSSTKNIFGFDCHKGLVSVQWVEQPMPSTAADADVDDDANDSVDGTVA